jgi:AmmeMemoRadiSam system protein A
VTDLVSPEARETLREVALDAIRSRLAGRDFEVDLPASGPLSAAGSAFVTLEKQGRLRGCVGMIGEKFPLAEAVRQAALSAINDPRFPALSAAELPEITIEVSVLSPFLTVNDPMDVDVPEHGVYVADGAAGALLLPRVARDRGWDRDRLLTEVCRKAGLEADRWRKPGLTIKVFTADEF